jgi:hypothetical protein
MPETARMFFGSLDEAHPPREGGAVDDCAVILPGDEYIVKGWILPTDPGDPAVTMEISDGETRWTLPINRRRVDVEREHHTQQRVGFEGKIDLGERPGKRTLSFTAITDRTRRLDLDMAEIFRASAPLEPLAGNCGGAAQGRFRRVEEVGRLPMPFGMTSRRIARPEFGMYVKGWIIGDATGTDGETEIVIALEGRTVAHTYRTRSTVDGEPTMLGLTCGGCRPDSTAYRPSCDRATVHRSIAVRNHILQSLRQSLIQRRSIYRFERRSRRASFPNSVRSTYSGASLSPLQAWSKTPSAHLAGKSTCKSTIRSHFRSLRPARMHRTARTSAALPIRT